MSAQLYSELSHDPELQEIVACFVDEMPLRVDAMREHFGAGDLNEIRRLAHQVKGAAGSYGFPSLTTAAGHIETLAQGSIEDPSLKEKIDAFQEMVGLLSSDPPPAC